MTELKFELKAIPTDVGFDILAISEGLAKGHDIIFGREVLNSAMPLYDGVPVFIDHPGFLSNGPSVRDLAGTLHTVSWNETEKGIQAKLTPAGPAKQVLLDVRTDAKTNPDIMKAVGFSTVLNVKLNEKREVVKIVKVRSVDVVIDPARGGKFLSQYPNEAIVESVNPVAHARRASKQISKGVKYMPKKKTEQAAALSELGDEEEQLTEQERAALELQGVNETIADLQEKQKHANDMLLAQCRPLLDAGLAASKLPVASQKVIRKHFETMLDAGTPFKPTDLEDAIKEKREELSEISASNEIKGPGRNISGLINSQDQFRLAITDLFGVDRDPAEVNIKIHRLRGIQEAYLMGTGDHDFTGGYFPEFAIVTGNFPAIVANVMNKILVKAWRDFEQVYGWWKKIATIEHFTSLNDITWVRTGTIASLPVVAERGDYLELPIGDNKEVSSFSKYGGYVPLTIEAVLRDDLNAFKRMPREVALGGIRNISEQVAAIFTQDSGAGPTLQDTGALFNSIAVTSAGGHANLLTTALGTDFVAWDAVATAVYNQPLLVKNATGYYGTGKKMAIEPKFCLVPRALKAAAEALFIPRWAPAVEAIASKGGPTYAGFVEPLTVPEWTDATDWAAAVDPMLVPGVMIGEIFGVMPQIFSASSEIDPAMFANDESRIKVRQFLAVGVADFRPLHKSNVA